MRRKFAGWLCSPLLAAFQGLEKKYVQQETDIQQLREFCAGLQAEVNQLRQQTIEPVSVPPRRRTARNWSEFVSAARGQAGQYNAHPNRATLNPKE